LVWRIIILSQWQKLNFLSSWSQRLLGLVRRRIIFLARRQNLIVGNNWIRRQEVILMIYWLRRFLVWSRKYDISDWALHGIHGPMRDLMKPNLAWSKLGAIWVIQTGKLDLIGIKSIRVGIFWFIRTQVSLRNVWPRRPKILSRRRNMGMNICKSLEGPWEHLEGLDPKAYSFLLEATFGLLKSGPRRFTKLLWKWSMGLCDKRLRRIRPKECCSMISWRIIFYSMDGPVLIGAWKAIYELSWFIFF
jgi:hypothetical protein